MGKRELRSRRYSRIGFAAPLLIGVIALALASGSAALAANAAVAMTGFQFVPATVTVNVGDTVTWTNQDGVPHSARADNGAFDTGFFSSGSRAVTMSQAGTFGYFCAAHPTTMRGTVNVVGAATPPPATAPPPTQAPPTAPPTTRPTVAPTARPATATPTPVATPTASAAPTPTNAASPTASPVALQVSPTPTRSPGSSQTGDGALPPLLVLAVIGGIGATGVAIWLIRRR